MLKRSMLLILWTLILLLIAVGCSSSSGTDGKTEDGKTVLTLWWNVDETDDIYGYTDALDRYEELNPDIKIETQTLPYDQLKQKLTTSANNGNPPDIARGLGEWIADFSQMGVLEPVTDEVNNWEEKQFIPDSVWEGMTVGGEIVGFPNYLGNRVQMYHADMLKEAGVDAPPKTWDELLDAGQKLKDAGVSHPYGISATSTRAPQELAAYIWSSNLDIVTEQGDGKFKNTWTDSDEQLANATEVFQFYKDMQETGVISTSQNNWGWEELDQSFVQGSVAIVQNGTWIKSYEEKHPEEMKDIKISGVPVYNETPATFLEVAPMFVFKDSQKKEEAIEFLKWMGTKEAQKIYANDSRTVRSDMDLEGEWAQGFTAVTEHGRAWPPVPLGGITESMKDSIQKVLLDDTTPEETAIWLSEQINQSLADNGLLSE